MKTITVRGLENDLLEKMKQTAKQEGKSVNQFVVDTVKTRLGMSKEKKYTRTYHDLDHLFGKWSEDEFEKIQGKIDAERKTDPELWQ